MNFKIYSDSEIKLENLKLHNFELTTNQDQADLAITALNNTSKIKAIKLCYSSDENVKNIESCKQDNIKHLLGAEQIKDSAILGALLECLLIKKKYVPNLFLTKSMHHLYEKVTNNLEINSKQDSLLKQINEKISWDYHRDHFQLILNELLTNAFYNASGHNQTTRSNLIPLENISPVDVNCYFDEQYFICAVKDHYGALTWEKFISALHRAMVEKAPENKMGGAGLGLYLIFSHSASIAINVRAGEYTEFFWILEKSKRQKDNLTRAKSLYFFEVE